MKNWIIAAVCVAGFAISWELVARATASKDKETNRIIAAVLISKTCPQMPEARRKATSWLLWHALKKPHTMPPWQLARILLTPFNAQELAGNPFPEIACRMLMDRG